MKEHTKRMTAVLAAGLAVLMLASCGGQKQAKSAVRTMSESPATFASFSSLINPDASPTAIPTASASEATETAGAGQTESEPAESVQTEETRQAGSRKEEPQKNRTEETEQPEQQKPAAAEPENVPAQTPEPEPAPTPESELEWSGDSYGSAVCEGVNEVRAMYGKEPLSYGGKRRARVGRGDDGQSRKHLGGQFTAVGFQFQRRR